MTTQTTDSLRRTLQSGVDETVLVVKEAAIGQTNSKLQEWQDNDGNVVGSLSPSGALAVSGALTASGAVTGTGAQVFTASAATDVPLTAKGAASQSAHYLDVKNSAGTAIAYIDALQRLHVLGKTAVVAGDFALHANWGGAATATVTTGSTDVSGSVMVTASTTTPGANPTVIFTFKDGTWTNAPFAIVTMSELGTTTEVQKYIYTVSATALTITYIGTPVDTHTYTFTWLIIGR